MGTDRRGRHRGQPRRLEREVCFGETDPPPGCEDPSCEDDAQPRETDDMGGEAGCCDSLVPL